MLIEYKDGNDKIAIDYGCGTGLVGLQLMDDFKSMFFIDASSKMVEQIKEKIRQLEVHDVIALCCDFEKETPHELETDYIILAQTLLHIKDYESLLAVLYGILNDGGHLLIVDFDKNDGVDSEKVHNGFEQEKLTKTLEEVGFSDVESETFYHGKNLFMNQDASLFIVNAVK